MRPLTLAPLLALFMLHAWQLTATPITSLDAEPSELAAQLQSPTTLVLTVHSQSDLPHAQRLLTLAASRDLPALVLIALPENALQAMAVRRAANRYFKSDFSRPRTYFIATADHPYPEFKTLLLSPVEPDPLFASTTYPESLPPLRNPNSNVT